MPPKSISDPSESETSQGTWEDHQMQIMGDLALLQFLQNHFLPGRKPTAKTAENSYMLDWIASCFEREDEGDFVATALATSPGNITFYLAANRHGGKSEPEDRANMVAFQTLLRELMRSYKDPCTDTKPSGDTLASWRLAKYAISASTVGVARRLGVIVTIVNDGPQAFAVVPTRADDGLQTLRSSVKTWYASFDAPEEEPRLAAYFCAICDTTTEKPPCDMLLDLLDYFLAKCEQGSKEGAQQRKSQENACFSAEAVASSAFFKRLQRCSDPRSFGSEFAWLSKLKRRIWRVAHFVTDARPVVEKGFPMFERVLGDNLEGFLNGGPGITLEWVGDHAHLPAAHGVAHTWPSSAKDRLDELVAANNPTMRFSTSLYEVALGQVFSPEKPVTPCLHCELQIIEYLQAQGIVAEKTIGGSKLACIACNAYVREINLGHNQDDHWKLRACSNNYHHDWVIPPNDAGARVVTVVRNELCEALREIQSHWTRRLK